jgi:hypothetical protein
VTRKTGILIIPYFFIFLFLCTPVLAQSNSPYPDFGLGAVFGVGWEFIPDMGDTVNNVPARFRSLPSHPGDGWIYGRQQVLKTIPFDTINPNPVTMMYSYYFGPEITVKRFSIKGGLNFAEINKVEQGLCKCNEGATREVNQRGLPYRGYSTSLVYYNMYYDTSYVPGYFFETGLNVHRWASLIAGTSTKHFNIMTETGYDRFNRLEEYETRNVGRAELKDAYTGVEFQMRSPSDEKALAIAGFKFLAGKMLDRSFVVDGMELNAHGQWYMKMGIVFHISSM